MQLLFLGSGSAHTVGGDNFQSNMLLTADSGQHLLIDCGTDIRWSLAKRGLSYRDITDIYVSHLHADHVGGLEYVGFTTKFDPHCRPPRLYLERSLADPLWNHVLRGGMGYVSDTSATLNTFFDVRTVAAHQPFLWQGVPLQPVRTIHVSTSPETVHSYGLLIGEPGERVFLTTDTKYTPDHLAAWYALADVIFHDCETAATRSGIHAHYQDLRQLPRDVRAKTWLYHYQPGPLPDAVADGFLGFVRPGQSFELSRNPRATSAIAPHRSTM
jgi:ribonuclease BN (tRNA processing enzyme)